MKEWIKVRDDLKLEDLKVFFFGKCFSSLRYQYMLYYRSCANYRINSRLLKFDDIVSSL